MTRTRKALISLLVMGALAAVGAGTYASFTAQTNNANNTFQTGTITLSDTVNAGTACWSTGTANGQGSFSNGNVNNCTVLVSASTQKPGGATLTAVITAATAGSLTPSAVKLAASCATTAVAASANGNGDLCQFMGLTIQPCATYTSGLTCGTPTATCLYPANGAAACAATPSVSGGPPPTTGTLKAATVGSFTLATGALAATSYQISWNLPDSGVAGQENSVQGLLATWSLSFTAVQ